MYKIIHERQECIACSACARMDSKNWRMNSDGKADLLQVKDKEAYPLVKDLEEGFELSLEVAQSCPVNVIHIEKDGSRLI